MLYEFNELLVYNGIVTEPFKNLNLIIYLHTLKDWLNKNLLKCYLPLTVEDVATNKIELNFYNVYQSNCLPWHLNRIIIDFKDSIGRGLRWRTLSAPSGLSSTRLTYPGR